MSRAVDPVMVAAYLVRDCLETLIQRHARTTDATSSAVVTLAMSLLEHLDGDAKQVKADRP